MKGKIITLMCATALLSSCHIYKAYDRPEDIVAEGLYRDTVSITDTLVSDTANFGNVPWREVFTDPQLQGYIETALTNNADLRSAMLSVDQAKAALMSAIILVLFALMLVITYSIGDGTPLTTLNADAQTYNTPFWLKATDMWIQSSIVLFVLIVAAICWGTLKRTLNR